MTTPQSKDSVSLVIAALGGEGGGVLTDWIVSAATEAGLPVQSTSIPGVAQRTGATTYYIEIYPEILDPNSGPWPVMGLYPKPGRLDIMVASELLEAGRGLANAWITPERTTLIASTHRHYAIAEKAAMGDGRFDIDAIRGAAEKLAKRLLLKDYKAMAEAQGTVINAVILGVIAATKQLPLSSEQLANAIRAKGIAVDASLAGFNAGAASVDAPATPEEAPVPDFLPRPATGDPELERRIEALPASVRPLAANGVIRLIDYQDTNYANLYLDRLENIATCTGATDSVTTETARHLALWMSYEDIIRVADLKSRQTRRSRVRREVRADADQVVQVTDFFKPGADEIADILPVKTGERLRKFASTRNGGKRFSMRVRADSVTGHLKLRALSRMRKRRPQSLRFAEEQQLIEQWLQRITDMLATSNVQFAAEIVQLATLNKGYGDTFRRGRQNFKRVFAEIDSLAGQARANERLRGAREAALADPEGDALDSYLHGTV